MLSDIPRRQLVAIYTLNGKVADDDKLCEAFLRDYCGECRREIAALSAAVRWGVPKSLRDTSQMPAATLRTNLARRLEENQGLDSENALWAVDTWASVIRPPHSGWPLGAPPGRPAPAAAAVRAAGGCARSALAAGQRARRGAVAARLSAVARTPGASAHAGYSVRRGGRGFTRRRKKFRAQGRSGLSQNAVEDP